MNLGSIGKKSSFDPVGGTAGKIDKVGVGQPQSGADAVAGAGPIGQIDVPKIANELAQSLGAAADKFRMLSAVNPFSQKAGMMMDMLTKGHDTIKNALDDWGKSLREQAEKDKVSHEQKQLVEQPLKKKDVDSEQLGKRFGA